MGWEKVGCLGFFCFCFGQGEWYYRRGVFWRLDGWWVIGFNWFVCYLLLLMMLMYVERGVFCLVADFGGGDGFSVVLCCVVLDWIGLL